MDASAAAARALRLRGITNMFGVIGDGNFRLAFAAEACGIDYYATNHESSAVSMADAWTRVTGRVGVATVTKGPGLTNTVTALTEAVKAQTPLLLLAGDTPRAASTGPQMIDQARLVESVGAGVQRFRTPELLATDVLGALDRAVLERRPIVLSIPTDAQAVDVGGQLQTPRTTAAPVARAGVPTSTEVDAMVAAINRSERPVVLAGWGAHVSGAEELLSGLAERIGALLTTTAPVKGMFGGDPFCVGVSGGFSSDLAADLLRQADLVLAFGASLNSHTTRHGKFYNDSFVIHVEDRADRIGLHFSPSMPVLGDAAATAKVLVEALDAQGIRKPGFRNDELAVKIKSERVVDPDNSGSAHGTIHPRAVMAELNRSLPAEATVVTDGGQFFGFPTSYLDTPAAGRFIFPQAFQAMGLGLGFAAGISIARRPHDLTVAIIGDGGFRMSLGEVEGLVRLGRPVLIVILNDNAYGAEVHIMGHEDLAPDIALFPDRDFASVCRELGGEGLTVRSIDDLQALRTWLRDPKGVLTVDCKTDRAIPSPFMGELLETLRS